MKAGIYCPYFGSVLGGGERYLLTIAKCLIDKDHQVDIFWSDESIKQKALDDLKLDLSSVNFVNNPFRRGNLFVRFSVTRKYDLIFYMSDGSLPFLFGRKNLIHFQIPFTNVDGKRPINFIKKLFIKDFFCNSLFTKRFVDKEFGVSSKVVYPPVAVNDFKPAEKKENIILSVGRFTKVDESKKGTRLLHEKKQAVLIEVFKDLIKKKKLKGWSLKIVGGAFEQDMEFVEDLKKQTEGCSIEILPNLSFKDLQTLYGRAKIYWHAAGFEEDEEKFPERSEHFGIVVVEAMAAGLVPVVIGQGGTPEIIEDKKNGFLWRKKKALLEITHELIKNPEKMERISREAQKKAGAFSQVNFCKKVNELVED